VLSEGWGVSQQSPCESLVGVRIGAVSYLNAWPLVFSLPRLAPAAKITVDLPSRLADDLAGGRLDAAIVPSIELLRDPAYQIVSDACIACDGPVQSVKLYSRVPIERLRSLALDEGSRTSATLVRILLLERFGLSPELTPLPIGATLADTSADAAMLVGDRGLRPCDEPFEFVWDLGEEWTRWSGLPFVFALWVARAGLECPGLAEVLSAARDDGIGRLGEIARAAAPEVGLPESACLAYLRDHLHFHLGPRQRQGLELFYTLAARHGLVSNKFSVFSFQFSAGSSPLPSRERGGGEGESGEGDSPIFAETKIGTVPVAQRALERALAGRRLDPADGLALLAWDNLAALGEAADTVTRRTHPQPYRTYNIDRNINYTNVCTSGCRFCAFSRPPGDEAGYVLGRDELYGKIDETIALGGRQILLQGGMHPELKLPWYEQLLCDIKRHFPQVHVHGFSPTEIDHVARVSALPVTDVLLRLKQAGLGSLPGGGAEILVDRVRRQISPCKVSAEGWLEVCRAWHVLGGRGSATMMFGHVETLAERIEHLERLRRLQDQTHGFTAFIAWTFQPDHTELADLPRAGAFEYLRTLAVARLYLDNFPNVQASWVTQGLSVGQMALRFGANDMGSLMIEENVVAAAGTCYRTTEAEIRRSIEEAGYAPRKRNVFYELVE
jgi:cyclic dehypoxanthinyl futalosine synthase